MMLIIALFLPALIGTINRWVKDKDARFWISFLLCAVVGGLYNFIEMNGVYTGLTMLQIADSVGKSIGVMFTTVKLSYELFWDNEQLGKFITDSSTTPLDSLGLSGGSVK